MVGRICGKGKFEAGSERVREVWAVRTEDQQSE